MVAWWKIVFWARILSVLLFLVVSLKFNIYTLASFLLVLLCFYGLQRNRFSSSTDEDRKVPHFKHKSSQPTVPQVVVQRYEADIVKFALSYDPENSATLEHFDVIKRASQCIFAKQSVLWGAADYDPSLSLEENVLKCVPQLIRFLVVGAILHLDGFVFKLPGEEFGQNIHDFARGVYRVLKCLSSADPSGMRCMEQNIDRKEWHFVFNGEMIFVTTFAPCYPSSSSRYAHGAEHGFVLLQPMYSFSHHDIGEDTPTTNWENPKTFRDKIRVAFKANGRPYHIRDTVFYPTAHDIVKPLHEGEDIIEWWKN